MRQNFIYRKTRCYSTATQMKKKRNVLAACKNGLCAGGPRATSLGKNARLKALRVLYHLVQLAYKEPCILYIMR
jgi:hypothetical protein